MKVDRKIRAMKWPEAFRNKNRKISFKVTAAQPIINGHRLLVVTFNRNRLYRVNPWEQEIVGNNFRLVCNKANMELAVITENSRGVLCKTLNQALAPWHTGPTHCYPEIDANTEAALCRWLGVKTEQRQACRYNHALDRLDDWTVDAVEAMKLRAADARGELRDEDVNLCPKELPNGLLDYIRNVILPEDNVLVYKHGNVRGTCFLCGNKVHADHHARFLQHHAVACPACGATVRCVLEGGQAFQADNLENVATIQRGSDGRTLFIRQWRILRPKNPAELRENTAAYLKETARYAVRGNKAAKWQSEAKENWCMNTCRYDIGSWARMNNVSEVYDGAYYFYLPPDWQEIVSTTSLKYIDLAGCELNQNPIRFILDWARYPAVELLWKAGYTELVKEKVTGRLSQTTRNTIHWSKRSLQAAMPLPLRLLREKEPSAWQHNDLLLLAKLWASAAKGVIKEADIPLLLQSRIRIEYIDIALRHTTVKQVVKYIQKQQTRQSKERGYNIAISRVSQDYRDYLADCQKLALTLADKQILFPPDLAAAHQRTTVMIRYEVEAKKEAAFAKAVKKLQPLAWHQGTLLIRPAATIKELIEEGSALHHCVGGYADRMAKGQTAIFLVRQAKQPDKPFYTLELRDKAVIQCRTDHNSGYEQNEAVKAFVDAWLLTVVNQKSKKRQKISAA